MSQQPPRPTSRSDFRIAIICALTVESNAVEASIDHFHKNTRDQNYGKAPGDQNAYTFGQLGGHNVVIAYLPNMGKASAAATAASFRTSFPNINLGLVVGICGGVPHPAHHDTPIFLGDVVISTNIIQYDLGRLHADKLIHKDTLDDKLPRPTREIRSFLQRLQGWHASAELEDVSGRYVAEICSKRGFRSARRPPPDQDRLYRAGYRHKHHGANVDCECASCVGPEDPICEVARDKTCEELGCDEDELIPIETRRNHHPSSTSTSTPTTAAADANTHTDASDSEFKIHFGRIASGDNVIKSSTHRDRIASAEKVIAFEMEGAGVWDSFPTIVIKGVADYADSHKNKVWQAHAAVVAAACAKAVLGEWPGDESIPPSASKGGGVVGADAGVGGGGGGDVAIHGNTVRNEGDNYGTQTGFNFGTNSTNYYAVQKNVENIMAGEPMDLDPGRRWGGLGRYSR